MKYLNPKYYFHSMPRRFYFLFVLFVLQFLMNSCNKNKFDVAVKEVSTAGGYDLNAVYFINDKTGFAAGGKRYEIGVLMKTTDGGNTWTAPDSVLPKACYTILFFNEQSGMIGAYDSYLGYTFDTAKTFGSRTFNQYLPTRVIKFRDNQNGILIFGNGYGGGAFAVTKDGGQSWFQSEMYNHAFRSGVYNSDGTIFIGGYGTILVSSDGQNFSVSKQYGDFYTGMFFTDNNTGFAVGYQGEIIKTTNKGSKWEVVKKINNPFETPDHLLAVHFFDASNGVAVGETGLMLRTTDGGESWKRAKPFTDKSLRAVQMLSATSGVIAAEGGSVFLFNM